ncbi:MAG: GNAT family N-acetyltransferase [Pseudonocardiaceae bacterium]
MRLEDVEPDDSRLQADVFPVLVQLRQHLSAESLAAIYAAGHPQGLRFLAAYDDQRCVGVAGWRSSPPRPSTASSTSTTSSRPRTRGVAAWARRGRGVGAALLTELTDRARAAGCSVLDLDSGVQRAGAHRFYFREHMRVSSFHFSRQLT